MLSDLFWGYLMSGVMAGLIFGLFALYWETL